MEHRSKAAGGRVAVSLATAVGLVAALVFVALGVSGGVSGGRVEPGTLHVASAFSPALGEEIDYTVYLPAGYEVSTERYPVLYLLHGRGDTMEAWTRVKPDLDQLIADGTVPPLIAVLPDAPWSSRGNWYVDSAYTGPDPGRPVETALTGDLVSHVDATYRTAAHRRGRLVGGYSMGGAGALRFALAHQELFANALVLSPAVYNPLPPADSSTREFGAFGVGEQLFVDDVYTALNYPALLPTLDPDLPIRMYIAVGDDEWPNPDPADARHDLDYEAATLYNAARRSPAISAELRVVDGGHDWDVWRPQFIGGLEELSGTLSATPPTGLPAPLYGTGGADWAGGVAPHADGSVTLGLAVSGSLDGQPYAGGLDAVVTRLGAGDRTPLWSRQFGTPANERLYGVVALADGGVIAAGYTRGDLDDQHPANPADDFVVIRLSANGEVVWLRQLGDAAKADRAYGIALAPDGGVYIAGYTSGSLDGPSAGDKDAMLARFTLDGTLEWVRQLGGPGEDKAYAVAADDTGVYVVGSAGAGLPGADALGGVDGWIARYSAAGDLDWARINGGGGDDLLAGVAVVGSGRAVATGTTAGEAGDREVLTAAYSSDGRARWTRLVGGRGDDVGAEVVPLPDGELLVVGFTSSALAVPAGGLDVLTVRLDRRGRQRGVAQFGTVRDDAGDAFGEENVFAALAGDRVLVTGITTGTPVDGVALGNGDVFLAAIDPATGLP